MKSVVLQRSSRIKLYWCVWLVLVAVAVALRFTFFAGASEQRLFTLASSYAIGTWLPIIALNLMEGHRLTAYLKTRHYQKWEELNYVPILRCVGHNGFRMVRWLYSKDDFGDPALARLKSEYRRFIRFALSVLLSYVIIMPVLLGL